MKRIFYHVFGIALCVGAFLLVARVHQLELPRKAERRIVTVLAVIGAMAALPGATGLGFFEAARRWEAIPVRTRRIYFGVGLVAVMVVMYILVDRFT